MDDATPEEWRAVPGYEGLYEVSDAGGLRSVRRTGTSGGTKKTPTDKAGYPHTSLCKDGQQVTWRLHQLVAVAFLGPYPPGEEVRHLDGNPLNSAAANLAYGSSAANKYDTVNHGNHWEARRDSCANGHEFTPENTRIRLRGNGGKTRVCRTCVNDKSREFYARRRAAARAAATRALPSSR